MNDPAAMPVSWIEGRSLAEKRLEEIAAIDIRIPAEFDATWKANETAGQERVHFLRSLSDADFFQVLLQSEAVVGFHIICDLKNSIGQIVTLWVEPTLRGRGMGKQLKEAGVAWARRRGLAYLQTDVHARNARMNEINLKAGYEIFSTTYRRRVGGDVEG